MKLRGVRGSRNVEDRRRSGGKVPQPHSLTHGTSEQRQRWFATGCKTTDANMCDTFGTRQL